MNMFNLNPDDYTEGKNPALSFLFHTLISDMAETSSEVQALQDRNTLSQTFLTLLSESQTSVYDDLLWAEAEIDTKVEAERFILGFKIATLLHNETEMRIGG